MKFPSPTGLPFFLFNSGITRLSVLLQTLITFIDPKPVRIRGLRFLRNGAALRSKRWHGKRDYVVYVINRKRDSDRLARFSRTCARWRIPYSRVDGVDLQQNPDLLLQHSNKIAEYCYNRKNFVKGIYGCFLGHREAWLRFQDSGDDWALICEDDARFLGPIPRCIQDFCIPPGTELVFVNQRMATGLLHHEQHVKRPGPLFDLVPTRTAVQALLAMDPHIDSPGGDGYLLSKHGVDKLLHAFEHSQMAFDVDWFMLFHCLDDLTMQYFLSVDPTDRFTGFRPDPVRVRAMVLLPSLIVQAEGISKVRRSEFCSKQAMLDLA